MSLKEKIFSDLVSALKSRDEDRVSLLKLLKNSIQKKEKEAHKKLDDNELIKVLLSESKQRKDSMEQFKKGGRDDLVAKEAKELEIIENYLPEMKSEGEIKNLICDIIKEESIDKSMNSFGLLMKLSMEKLGGLADGKVVSQIVKEELI